MWFMKKRKIGSVKQMFNMTTMEDNKHVPRRGGGNSKSLVSELVDVQKSLKEDIETITIMVALRDTKIVALKVTYAQRGEIGTSLEKELRADNAAL